jgi:hypothetical protein
MNNKNKLTILLILKDRVRFTYRWLEYYKNNLSSYKLIIADGSVNNSLEKYIKKKLFRFKPNLQILRTRRQFRKIYIKSN